MRKTIAERMHASLTEMAQLTMDMDVNMDDAIKLRTQLVEEWADEGVKPTYTDLVIRAAARALKKHPLMNSSWGEKEIALHGDVHVGMAVSLDEGLIVPVVRHADAISVKEDWGHSSNIVGVDLCHRAKVRRYCMFHHEPIYDDEMIFKVLQETIRYEEITRETSPLKVSSAYDGLVIDL